MHNKGKAMLPEQKIRPELIYRLNNIVLETAKEFQELHKLSVIPIGIFDFYTRTFHSIPVDKEMWDYTRNLPLESITNLKKLINKDSRYNWEKFKDQLKVTGRYLESEKDAAHVLEECPPNPGLIHNALMTLYQSYPIHAERFIDGIVLRNLKRRVEKQYKTKKDPSIDYAIAELLINEEEVCNLNATFFESPWCKIEFQNKRSKEVRWSCQEYFKGLYPEGEPDLEYPKKHGRQVVLPKISDTIRKKAEEMNIIGDQRQHFYYNCFMPFFMYKEQIGKFVTIRQLFKKQYKYIIVFPIYDAPLGDKYYGNIICTFQFPRQPSYAKKVSLGARGISYYDLGKAPEFIAKLKDYSFIPEIKKAFIHDILKQPFKKDGDLLKDFISVLPMLQDWESVLLWKPGEKKPRICYIREIEHSDTMQFNEMDKINWIPCTKNQCDGCPKVRVNNISNQIIYFNTDAFVQKEDNNIRQQVVFVKNFFNKNSVPLLREEICDQYQDYCMILEYPSYTLIPKDEVYTLRLWLYYQKEQLDLLRQLTFIRNIKLEESRRILFSTKAAFSGIMSRNLSHNIGSHVISYWIRKGCENVENILSTIGDTTNIIKNELYELQRNNNELDKDDIIYSISKVNESIGAIFKEPEDFDNFKDNTIFGYIGHRISNSKKLFQYLQQRMDFIAEITTAAPTSVTNMDFENDILKPFIGDPFNSRSRKDRQSGIEPLLQYISRSENIDLRNQFTLSILSENRRVAIPNGITGAYAIYSIIENFIRNAAKHFKNTLQAMNKTDQSDNTSLFEIELREPENDTWQKNYYEIRLKDLRQYSCFYDKGKKQAVVPKLFNFLDPESTNGNFTNKDGELNTTAWGLKEMRICANFLRKGTTEMLISALPSNIPPLIGIYCNESLCTQSDTSSCIANSCNNQLCISFFVFKPKDLYIKKSNNLKLSKEDKVTFGIEINKNDKKEAIGDEVIPHRMMALENITDIHINNSKLPCRLLPIDYDREIKISDEYYLNEYEAFIQKMHNTLTGYEALPKLLFTGDAAKKNYQEIFGSDLGLEKYGEIIYPSEIDKYLCEKDNCALFYHHASDWDLVAKLFADGKLIYLQPLSSKYSSNIKLLFPPQTAIMKKHFILELIESVLTRIIILDERVAELANENYTDTLKVGDVLTAMNIFVVPISKDTTNYKELLKGLKNISSPYNKLRGKNHPYKQALFLSNTTVPHPCFFISHLGILEKLDTVDYGKAKKLLDQINCQWKVIDSGRGIPSGIESIKLRFVEISALMTHLRDYDKHGLVQMLFSSRYPK